MGRVFGCSRSLRPGDEYVGNAGKLEPRPLMPCLCGNQRPAVRVWRLWCSLLGQWPPGPGRGLQPCVKHLEKCGGSALAHRRVCGSRALSACADVQPRDGMIAPPHSSWRLGACDIGYEAATSEQARTSYTPVWCDV